MKHVREYRRCNQNGQPRETGNIGTQDEEKHRETGNIGTQDEEKQRETANIGTQDEEKLNKTQQNICWTPLCYYNLTILICFFISLLICNILLSYIFRATIWPLYVPVFVYTCVNDILESMDWLLFNDTCNISMYCKYIDNGLG